MAHKLNKICVWVTKYLIVLILLASGISKIVNPEQTLEILRTFNLFSETTNLIIISILPVTEILLAVLLLTNYKTTRVNLTTLVLFTVFFIISISGYLLGFNKDCGCFGKLVESSFGISMIIRNLFFLLMTLYLFKYNNVCAGKTK